MMGGVDIAAFLAARLDEDEQAARAAAAHSGQDWYVSVEDAVYSDDHPNLPVAVGPWNAGMHDAVAALIVRHDPARVLAEVAAKRAVLDEYRWAVKSVVDYPDDRSAVMAKWAFKIAVRAHVQPYADHPDFDPAWALQHA